MVVLENMMLNLDNFLMKTKVLEDKLDKHKSL